MLYNRSEGPILISLLTATLPGQEEHFVSGGCVLSTQAALPKQLSDGTGTAPPDHMYHLAPPLLFFSSGVLIRKES